MKRFKEYLYLEDYDQFRSEVLQLAIVLENYDRLDESSEDLNENVRFVLDKAVQKGLIKKQPKWMQNMRPDKRVTAITHLIDFGTNGSKLLMAAIKGDKEKVKKYSQTFTADKFFDFLLKLDGLTLGLLAAPLNLIEGITGWDIRGSIKAKLRTTKRHLDVIKFQLDKLKLEIKELFDPRKDKDVWQQVDNLESTLIDKITPKL